MCRAHSLRSAVRPWCRKPKFRPMIAKPKLSGDTNQEGKAVKNDELTNIDIVLYALLQLGGHKQKVHTEEIAYEAYKLAKDRFGWRLRKFRETDFPDKEPVRISLMDAAKEKYGSLAEGRSGVEAKRKEIDGWTFTPEGVRWIREHQKRIERQLGTEQTKISKKDTDRFIRQMRVQPLFQSFIQNNLTKENRYALTDMLNTSPDAPKIIILKKFKRLRSTAELVGDQDIIRFLDACTRAFPVFLADQGSEGEH